MTDYPPQPWDLRGDLHVSTFLVPAALVPLEPPPGWRPVRVFGRLVVGAAWVSYEPPGVLSYSELMATVLVRRGLRLTPTIVSIWVDSEASRAGGRALWAIPKDLARFAVHEDRWAAENDDGPIARASVRVRGGLRLRVPVRFTVAQTRDGQALVSPVTSRSRVALSRIDWDAARVGPIGFLAGRRPLLSASLRDFRMSFGRVQS